MARDVGSLMHGLGHERSAVVGHDRGAYLAHRIAADHPELVTHLAVLAAVPIGEALARGDVSGVRLESGHHMAEEVPQELAAELLRFLVSA